MTAAEAIEVAAVLGASIAVEESKLVIEWEGSNDLPGYLIESFHQHKAEVMILLGSPLPIEKKAEPDPNRGRVFVMDHAFSGRAVQSPTLPIPGWCFKWAQEGDHEWTCTGNPDPKEGKDKQRRDRLLICDEGTISKAPTLFSE